MSWLYSIVFAGLLFSSNSDTPTGHKVVKFAEAPAVHSKQDETEKFEQTYPLSANGRVSVSNVNGSIVVEAWDRNEVKLEVTKIGDSKESLSEVEIKIDAQADSFRVETDYSGGNVRNGKGWNKTRKLEVQFRLSVPRTAILNEIETVNGSVTVSNFVNQTKISAVNGNVIATNLRGAATLSTVNGEVKADFDRLESGNRISLDTVNGSVSLMLPSDVNATLKADSLNGSITNEFGLPVRKGQYVGRDMFGRLGNGDVNIRLNSVNGDLSIGRKKDGRNVNPVMNLLQQKGNNDDGDNDESINTQRMNRDAAKAIRDSNKAATAAIRDAQRQGQRAAVDAQREVRKAMADAQKELELAKPELDLELKELEKLNVNINTDAMKESIKLGLRAQTEALARMGSINWNSGTPFIEQKSNSFQVKGTPKVTIDARGCSVRVRGWDKAEVRYVLTESKGRPGKGQISVTEDQNDSGVSIRVNGSENAGDNDIMGGNNDRVRIEVFVPKKSNLKISTDREIRLDSVSGDIDLDGEDGAINLRDIDGKLHLLAADAQVRIIGFNGELDTTTQDGDVYLEGVFSKITSKAVDGKITLTLPAGTDADIKANVEALSLENLTAPQISDGNWRLGKGGSKYDFSIVDGVIVVRRAENLLLNP